LRLQPLGLIPLEDGLLSQGTYFLLGVLFQLRVLLLQLVELRAEALQVDFLLVKLTSLASNLVMAAIDFLLSLVVL